MTYRGCKMYALCISMIRQLQMYHLAYPRGFKRQEMKCGRDPGHVHGAILSMKITRSHKYQYLITATTNFSTTVIQIHRRSLNPYHDKHSQQHHLVIFKANCWWAELHKQSFTSLNLPFLQPNDSFNRHFVQTADHVNSLELELNNIVSIFRYKFTRFKKLHDLISTSFSCLPIQFWFWFKQSSI